MQGRDQSGVAGEVDFRRARVLVILARDPVDRPRELVGASTGVIVEIAEVDCPVRSHHHVGGKKALLALVRLQADQGAWLAHLYLGVLEFRDVGHEFLAHHVATQESSVQSGSQGLAFMKGLPNW